MNHLREAFLIALSDEGISKQAFAEQRGMKPWAVSRFLRDADQISLTMKRCILKKWSNPKTARNLFDAYVKDEAEIMGFSGQPEPE